MDNYIINSPDCVEKSEPAVSVDNVPAQLAELSEALESMDKYIAMVYDKLESVLIPPYPTETCCNEEKGYEERSYLTGRIRTFRNTVQSFNSRLMDIHDRIDL